MAGNDPNDAQSSMYSESTSGSKSFNNQLESASAAASNFNAFALDLKANGGVITKFLDDMFNAMVPTSDMFAAMDEYATQVQTTFGLSKERADEFKTTIANIAPELTKLGYTEGQFVGALTETMDGLGTAASVSKEAVVELAASSKVTGVSIRTLASSFREVGVSVYDVGEKMKTVTEVARGAGVSVSAVAEEVTSNLGKMNIYNFDTGVKGLAKMAATGERLGLTMDKVFAISEELMNPEKAIDMSAALQRLGVTSSGLLDPLRAMDMAQNDPEALQKEMVELSKTFTRFNEETGKMEILPGAKRRLREVAEAFGYVGAKGAEEFAALGIKSADFDMKLKQIRLPNLGEGDEETKELIASMAQMKDGVAQIEVRNKETGLTTTKKVEELTPEDIENLKKANEDASKSIEDIAFNQLDMTTQIKNLLESGVVATKFAKATTPTLSKFYGLVAESKLDVAKAASQVIGGTEDLRKVGESLASPIEDFISGKITGNEAKASSGSDLFMQNLTTVMDNFGTKVGTEIDKTQNSILDRIQTAYSKPIETKSTADVNLNMNITGDANVKNMDLNSMKKEIVDYLTATEAGKDLLRKAIENKNAPQ